MAPKAEQERKNREKSVQDKCQAILTNMLKDEDNKYCVDCDSKGPRWASWNLGMFLCIRCAGMHRNLGVHISKVKSVNLDTWTPPQVASMQIMGNSRARAVYEANLPEDHRRPQTDNALEAFIRAKYEKKKYQAREWVPSKPPDFPEGWNDAPADFDKVKKDFKKLGLPPVSGGTSPVTSTSPRLDKKPEQKPAQAHVQKPTHVQQPSAPTTSSSQVSAPSLPSSSADLLGLTTQPQALVSSTASTASTTNDLLGLDTFDAFVSAPAVAVASPAPPASTAHAQPAKSPHAQPTGDLDEINFFNQEAPAAPAAVDSGKMTNDSILALFGSSAANKFPSQPQQFAPQQNQFAPPAQQNQFPPSQQNQFPPNPAPGGANLSSASQNVLGLYAQAPQAGFPNMAQNNPFLGGPPTQQQGGFQAQGGFAQQQMVGQMGGLNLGNLGNPASFNLGNPAGLNLGTGAPPVQGTPGLSQSLWQ